MRRDSAPRVLALSPAAALPQPGSISLLLLFALPITGREATASSLLDCESVCVNLKRIVYEEALFDGHTVYGAQRKQRVGR